MTAFRDKARYERRARAKLVIKAADLPLFRSIVDAAESLLMRGYCRACAAIHLRDVHCKRAEDAKPVDERVAAAQARERDLQTQVDILSEALFARRSWMAPEAWGLTQSEEKILGVLVAREKPDTDAFMAALYYDLGRDEVEPKIVDQFIYRLRRKLKPFGVEIKTDWGRGYFLPRRTREKVKAGAERIAKADA